MKYVLTVVDVSRTSWRRMGKSYTVVVDSGSIPYDATELTGPVVAKIYEETTNDPNTSVVRRVIDVRRQSPGLV